MSVTWFSEQPIPANTSSEVGLHVRIHDGGSPHAYFYDRYFEMGKTLKWPLIHNEGYIKHQSKRTNDDVRTMDFLYLKKNN